jgi:hypothetical protein
MPIGSHALNGRLVAGVEIDKNITSVLVLSIGVNVDITSLPIPNGQESVRRQLLFRTVAVLLNWDAVQSRSPGNGLWLD